MRRVAHLIVLCVLAFVSLGLPALLHEIRTHDRVEAQARRGAEVDRQLRQTFERTEVGLRGVRALFDSSGSVAERQFRVFARTPLRQPALTAASYVEVVRRGERAGWERKHGLRIFEGDARTRSPRRGVHYPATLTAPAQNSERIRGFDFASSPLRLRALDDARDSGDARASAPLRTVRTGQRGLIVVLPVYRDGSRPRTRAERRGRLQGFVSGLLTIDDVLNEALGEDRSRVIRVLDGQALLAGTRPQTDAEFTNTVVVGGREWRVAITTEGLESMPAYVPWLVMGGGLAFTTLIGLLLLTNTRRARALALVETKTQEIADANQALTRANAQLQASRVAAEWHATTDELTGIRNRRFFGEALRAELARADREGISIGVLLLDIDHFKDVNDKYGHPAGDAVLRDVAERVLAEMRDYDNLARWGGEEFAVLLPGVERDSDLHSIGERVRRAVSAEPFANAGRRLAITVSLGGSRSAAGGTTPEEIMAAADQALYRAKHAGRNRVELIAGDQLESGAVAGS